MYILFYSKRMLRQLLVVSLLRSFSDFEISRREIFSALFPSVDSRIHTLQVYTIDYTLYIRHYTPSISISCHYCEMFFHFISQNQFENQNVYRNQMIALSLTI